MVNYPQSCITLKFYQVNGKQCGVAPSQDSDTLFVGNICKTWEKDIVSALSSCMRLWL